MIFGRGNVSPIRHLTFGISAGISTDQINGLFQRNLSFKTIKQLSVPHRLECREFFMHVQRTCFFHQAFLHHNIYPAVYPPIKFIPWFCHYQMLYFKRSFSWRVAQKGMVRLSGQYTYFHGSHYSSLICQIYLFIRNGIQFFQSHTQFFQSHRIFCL